MPPLPRRFQFVLSLFCFVSLAITSRAQAPSHKPPGSKKEQADFDIISAKINGIIIPEVKFDKTPLPEALEQLRAASRDLDKTADTKDRGINVFVKLRGVPSTPPIPITLDLKSVSLKDALEAVSKQANFSMKVERYAVALIMPPAGQ